MSPMKGPETKILCCGHRNFYITHR